MLKDLHFLTRVDWVWTGLQNMLLPVGGAKNGRGGVSGNGDFQMRDGGIEVFDRIRTGSL
ncbi:hypothetical protein [Pararobbsia alpina]|uniref:hypothetical protein n=1 Tax=Pararobbsia alpina TaxID=621374 RepID=UPI001582F9D1|nr:hypothetical protein [Pararobbsia alpina]